MVHALHLVQLLLDGREVVGGAPARRDHARLDLDAAAHVQRLQQRVAQHARVSIDSGMWMVPAETGLQQIGAAALARLDDAERLELADRLADGRAADRKSCHQLALGRQPVARCQAGPRDESGDGALERSPPDRCGGSGARPWARNELGDSAPNWSDIRSYFSRNWPAM